MRLANDAHAFILIYVLRVVLSTTHSCPSLCLPSAANALRGCNRKNQCKKAQAQAVLNVFRKQANQLCDESRPDKGAKSARAAALDHLRRIEVDNAYAKLLPLSFVEDDAVEAEGPGVSLDKQPSARDTTSLHMTSEQPVSQRVDVRSADAKEVTRLVSGITRWRLQLDSIISSMCKQDDADSLQPSVRNVCPLMGLSWGSTRCSENR
jgi:transcription termination factor NusB